MGNGARLKKMTVALPASLVDRLRILAGSKRIPSANAAVREAVERYIVDLEREDFRKAMEAAAADSEFLKDVATIERHFQHADAESARMISEW